MSHNVGTVPVLGTPFHIGPDTGEVASPANTWAKNLPHANAPGGTRFVILHFMNVTLPASNRLEVDLGYGMDVFTAADGGEFWTRPVNVTKVGAGTSVPIRYITSGANSGGAFVDRYARGEMMQDHKALHDSITNCNPFLIGGWTEPIYPFPLGTMAPHYDPYWMCDKDGSPRWDDARCEPNGDVRREVSRSVGMIVTVHAPEVDFLQEGIGTCSVTLIDSDLVVMAAHCVSDHPFEVPTSSVTFDYEVACDGTPVVPYDATFYKVERLVKYRYNDDRDYAILQLRGSPPLPPVPVRNADPDVGDPVFGVHHPNGAVKKISPLATPTTPVVETGLFIEADMDVAGGSSGSGLFDDTGGIVGVLSHGPACALEYSSMATMLADPIQVPDPPTERAVMLVLDRSGSMSEGTSDGKVKIDAARDAAEMFISMLRTSMGNQAGLVTFASDATSPIEGDLKNVTNGSKGQLLAELPGISPGGRTSIGDGLAAARVEFPMPGGPPRAILVLTDGMENEPQSIASVSGLGGIEITAIGFGTESNLDGAKLTDLAQTHGGFYKRAGTGLALQKFFALAFGDIFEAGALTDPDFHLPASSKEGPDVPFQVCGEEAITVVVGWDSADAPLLIEVRTPNGQVVNLGAGGIEMDDGATWRFARIPLPQSGERDGLWKARVMRAGRGGGEFPPPDVDVNYFVNINARGGPSLRPASQRRRLYTGDVINPIVMLQYADETVPRGGEVRLTLRRPEMSVGTILSRHGLGAARVVDGDVIPARQATLSAIEQASGSPITTYVEEHHLLTDDAAGSGSFMRAGRFGKPMDEVLVVEGNYSFHAKAQFGIGCRGTREAQWAYHVGVGIDPDSTIVVVEPAGAGPGGDRVRVTITPQDRYGNHLGPAAADDLVVRPTPGCSLVGGLRDLGDGRYVQVLQCGADSDDSPGISVTQPDREPVVLVPPRPERVIYRYTAKIVCGLERDDCCDCESVAPGRYATAITIYNGTDSEVRPVRHVVPTEFSGAMSGRWPDSAATRVSDRAVLGPRSATTIDCCDLNEALLGGTSNDRHPTTLGVVVIESPVELDVIAAYTVAAADGTSPSIDVEAITGQAVRAREERMRPALQQPPARPRRRRMRPAPRPQDTPRGEGERRPGKAEGRQTHDKKKGE